MMNGGRRAGAGRPKGAGNLATKEREARVRGSGATPLDMLLDSARWHHTRAIGAVAIAEAVRAQAAEDAASAAKTTSKAKKGEAAKAKDEPPKTAEQLLAPITSPLDSFITEEFQHCAEHAVKVATYVHPKLSSVEQPQRTVDFSVYTDDEIAAFKRLLAKQLTSAGPQATGGPDVGNAGGRGVGTRH
jgi:hypothetical protein